MSSLDKLGIFLRLHQLISDIEDESVLLDNLLPEILVQSATIGFTYKFIETVFFDNNGNIQQKYFSDIYSQQDKTISFQNIVNLNAVFSDFKVFNDQLSKKGVIVISDISPIIEENYINYYQLKSVIICPVWSKNKMHGLILIGADRVSRTISEDEIELTKMLATLISLTFRIQNTQDSLTYVTQEVYKMNAKLHDLDKMKDDFVSIASHELRTPMTAIRSYVWMALYKSDIPLSQKLQKYLYRSMISTERLINMVNDMLNISRIESGRVEISPKPFDIIALCKDVVAEVDIKAREKSLKMWVVEDSKVPQVFADPDKVHQVLLNLIGNALKFTSLGGEVTVSFFSDGKAVDISVRDNGAGLSQEEVQKLFTKFGRMEGSYERSVATGGTGLGLYICKSLITMMKGKIWATSEGVGKGTTFIFSLPVASQDVLKHANDYQFRPRGEAKGLEPVTI